MIEGRSSCDAGAVSRKVEARFCSPMEPGNPNMSSAEASTCLTASMENKPTRVLVVEDEKLVNWSLVTSLTKWGFAVHPVFNGWDAVKEFQKCGFDVVLLDYRLPDLDGLAVARQIRHVQPDAVIVLLTSFPLSELPPDRSLINYYFNKPLDLGQLRTDLKRISNKQGLENGADGLLRWGGARSTRIGAFWRNKDL